MPASNLNTHEWLSRVADLAAASGDPDKEFYYLGGPMSGRPQMNFPAFDRAAASLRGQGYNIVSPAELDDRHDRAAALASKDGRHDPGMFRGKSWADFLERDCVIVSLPTCIGGIFLPGWQQSEGARLESYIIDRLGKHLYSYHEDDGAVTLTLLDRDASIVGAHFFEAVA